MNFTKSFKKISQKDISLTGGKGASLGEMIKAGIPAPDGFVVLTSAFEKFLKETSIDNKIKKVLEEINIEDAKSVAESSKIINNLICQSEIPEDIEKEIFEAYRKLNEQKYYRGNPSNLPCKGENKKNNFVAVRSSATSEDGKTDSWAGQLESYLNVVEENLIENIKKCWASLFTPRALFYRIEKKLERKKNSVAVVVQKMVQSEVAGVCFTVHPVSKNKNQLIIEAGYGLGEAIVSGMIMPDNYVVDKNNLKILDKNIFDQKKMIVRIEKGNKIVSVNSKKSKLQKLSDSDIIKLSRICVKIEKHYQKPQDIEWAFRNNKFYIIQSRPITTL